MGDDLKLSGGLSPGCAPSPYPQMGKWGVYPNPPIYWFLSEYNYMITQ